MSGRGKKKWIFWILAAAVYLLLIGALVLSEAGREDATIRSIPTALWYSITTLTTVGYGDTYPVTVWGRVIGFIFQLMSLGILAALFSLLLRALRGRLLPMFLLQFERSRTWAIFSAANEKARILAENLHRESPDLMILFADAAEAKAEDLPGVRTAATVQQLIRWQKGKGRTWVFCVDADPYQNRMLAQTLEHENVEVYCMSADEPETIPPRQTFFHEAECCARLYWRQYPVLDPHEKIVLIGDGPSARALLEQGLLVNAIAPDQSITYTVSGDWTVFRRDHPMLAELLSADQLRFLPTAWNEDWTILQEADRIIISFEEKAESAACLAELCKYCPVSAEIYIRQAAADGKGISFGSLQEILTPELVIRKELNHLAICLHQNYQAQNAGQLPAWEALSDFLRRSNLASADHLYMKALLLTGRMQIPEGTEAAAVFADAAQRYASLSEAGKTRCWEIEHLRWARFHFMHNWTYAEKRDNARRQHPLLKPFDTLTPEDQAKDAYAWELLAEAAAILSR